MKALPLIAVALALSACQGSPDNASAGAGNTLTPGLNEADIIVPPDETAPEVDDNTAAPVNAG